MSIFFNADCVINKLFENGFTDKKDWKHDNKSFYAVSFDISIDQIKNITVFNIVVSGGIHKTSGAFIRNMQSLYEKDLSALFESCVI